MENKNYKPYETLESGTYRCVLKVKDCEVKVMDWSTKPPKDTGRKKRGYRFSFKVEGRNAYINIEAGLNTSEKGRLWKLIQMLHDWSPAKAMQKVTFSGTGFYNGEESYFYGLAKELDGLSFNVTMKQNSGFHNFVCATPVDNVDEVIAYKQKKTLEAIDAQLEAFGNGEPIPPTPESDIEQLVYDDNDIPF